ncbi:MAG TPA: MFS transporter, partial [Devosia sp.]|nr:MFS transporter [Devosia sp.]
YVDYTWTVILTVVIGIILASAFSAIVVFAQELVPGRIGLIAGLFFGVAFGIGGIGVAALGILADHTSIAFIFKLCSFLPFMGLFAAFLPPIGKGRGRW